MLPAAMKSLGLALLALLLCPSPGESVGWEEGAAGRGHVSGSTTLRSQPQPRGALPTPEGIQCLSTLLLVLRRCPSFSEVHRASY